MSSPLIAPPPLSPLSSGSSFTPPISRPSSIRSSSASSTYSLTSPRVPVQSPLHSPATSPLPEPGPSCFKPTINPPSRNDIFGLSWNVPAPNLPGRLRPLPVPTPILTSPSTPATAPLAQGLTLRLCPTAPYLLGSGRHATVYAAGFSTSEDPQWSICAAKRAEPGEEAAAIREANILSRLKGAPHIVNLIGLVDEATACAPKLVPSRLTLLLEYCGGGTLYEYVEEGRGRRIGRRLWLRWAIEMTTAVARCREEKVLIGDLKPQNVLLTENGDIRLADFNRARMMGSEDAQEARAGTSAYAAPELLQAEAGMASWPADVFALALTLWYALTGREPYVDVNRPVEQMVLIARGAFWEHESRARSAAVGEPDLFRRARGCGPQRPPAISSAALQALLGYVPPSLLPTKTEPICNQPTPRSISPRYRPDRYLDSSPVVWFLDGQKIVDQSIMDLLKAMCEPDPRRRPEPSEILRRLKAIATE